MNGADLKVWRRERSLTQIGLALELDVTRQTVIAWENSVEPLPRVLQLALSALDQSRTVAGKRMSAAEVKAFRKRVDG